ncbi:MULTISPECIES: acyltransferase [Mycetohabitans]|uniref:Surface polysaccharide O-acyltransferase-like enzyme n=1 Tax=Mycetohabitans endofungorum TaxID=417203 RepID=A0A2P5KA44_9BURK|nr:acyltransferase [Mycetohabitans endofungorum]PPB83600.1 surface polysaccharide O-acyltransferase-like enzyme [Mycetohabitans endofungorum]
MDIARAFAICVVVFLHSVDTFMTGPIPGLGQWVVFTLLHWIGRLGVPIFLMLTGALVLPGAAATTPLTFYRRRIPQFVAITFIYTWGYVFLDSKLFTTPLPPWQQIADQILKSRYWPAYHLWYMNVIMALYLAAPFIGRIVERLRTNAIWLVIGLLIAIEIIPSAYHTAVYGGCYSSRIRETLALYPIYLLIGYAVVVRGSLTSISTKYLSALFSICVASILAAQLYLAKNNLNNGDGFMWYDSPLILIPAILVFLLCKRAYVSQRFLARCVENLARASFGIYLLHLSIVMVLAKQSTTWDTSPLTKAIITGFLVMAGSYLIWRGLHRVPLLRKLVE